MRLFLLLAILAFPIAEIWILVILMHQYGWLVVLYLLVVALLGFQLIREEKISLSLHLKQSLTQGVNPLKLIFGSARNIIAGILLIIPGVLTDIIAVILLLIRIPKDKQETSTYQTRAAANDDVIEGEFHRED